LPPITFAAAAIADFHFTPPLFSPPLPPLTQRKYYASAAAADAAVASPPLFIFS
jgi:hypothetical protein